MKHDNYTKYQAYLSDFRQKHPQLPITGSVSSQRKHRKSPFSSDDGSAPPNRPQSAEQREAGTFSEPSTRPSSASGQNDCVYIVNFAIGELSRMLEVEGSDLDLYDAHTLPPQHLVQSGVRAFFGGTDSLLFTYQEPHASTLLERIYTTGEEPDPLALVEVFAMAAIGSYFDTDAVPTVARKSLYHSCGRLLKGIQEVNDLRYMRLFLSLAFYCIMENYTSARILVSAAIQIGRLRLPLSQNPADDSEEEGFWRKIFRSCIFVESWFCYSLRQRSMITSTDKAYACPLTAYGLTQISIQEGIRYQTTEIAMLAAATMEHVTSPDSLRVAAIRYYMDKLNAWHAALPLTMRLATLSSEDSDMLSPNQKFSLLLVHLLYLGAVTLLHRPILAAVANLSRSGTWEVDAPPEEVRGFENDCITAASQGARVVALLKADGTFPKQCWIVV